MGSLGQVNALQPAPSSPDATDDALVAARRARAYSLFALGRGFSSDFTTGAAGTKATGTDVTYGQPANISGQVGDDVGLGGAPQTPGAQKYRFVPGSGLVPGQYVADPNGNYTQAQASSGKDPSK